MNQLKDIVGNTPAIDVSNLDIFRNANDCKAAIFAKLEYMNPSGSGKDRAAKAILQQLEQSNCLNGANKILIPTSGNLGISLSMLLENKTSHKIICAVPEKSSYDKIRLLKTSGVFEIIRTLDYALPLTKESPQGVCNSLADHSPGSLVIDEESGNWSFEGCYAELAKELASQCQGSVDCVIVPVETGNTITQLSKALKAKFPKIRVIGVEPMGSVFGETSKGSNINFDAWVADSYGNSYIPKTLDMGLVDEWIQVSDQDAYCTARALIKSGIYAGVSSGAAIYATKRFLESQAVDVDNQLKIAVLLSDSSNFYMSTLLNDEYMLNSGLADLNLSSKLYESLFDRYRAASIEDLQLPAAVAVQEDSTLGAALGLMIERDFTHVPVTTVNRKLVGYISKSAVEMLLSSSRATPNDAIGKYMYSFISKPDSQDNSSIPGGRQAATRPKASGGSYKIITPETPLVELAKFFEHHSVAFVTDISRKFCLGVVTKHDLIQFMERRQFINIY